jgi:hypothetical protein
LSLLMLKSVTSVSGARRLPIDPYQDLIEGLRIPTLGTSDWNNITHGNNKP